MTKEITDEDRIYARLSGTPVFLINRKYQYAEFNNELLGKRRYTFKFKNGYGASIIETSSTLKNLFKLEIPKYELGILDFDYLGLPCLNYDTGIADDVVRGDEELMESLLQKVEALESKFNPDLPDDMKL